MTWDKKVSVIAAIVGTVVAKWLGGWDMYISALVFFMVVDYITGIMRAFKDKELSSAIGMNGLFKKIMILIYVAVAVIIDGIVGTPGILRFVVVCWYASMEGISIAENGARLGAPMPDKLKDALLQIREGNKKAEPVVVTVNQEVISTTNGVMTATSRETITSTVQKEE